LRVFHDGNSSNRNPSVSGTKTTLSEEKDTANQRLLPYNEYRIRVL
jgi:hypothetical protein